MMEGVALMINVLLLPDASSLALLDITVDSSAKTITAVAATTSPQASCPACQQPSSNVQSRYVRTLADLPCGGSTGPLARSSTPLLVSQCRMSPPDF
jgi:hypothetical protein